MAHLSSDSDPRCPRPDLARQWRTPLHWWDKASYVGTDTWDQDRWRWEFMRRDDDYRRTFDELASQFGSTEHGVSPMGRTREGADADRKRTTHGPGCFSEEEQEQLLAAGLTYWPFIHSDCLRWAMAALYDPRISDWFGQGPVWGTGVRRLDPSSISFWGHHLSGFVFDKERPIGPQINEVKRLLEEDQRKIERLVTPRRRVRTH